MAYNRIINMDVDKSKIMDRLQEIVYMTVDLQKHASDVCVSQTNQPMTNFNRQKREIIQKLKEAQDMLYTTLSEKDQKEASELDTVNTK